MERKWNGLPWERHPAADGLVKFMVGDMCEESLVLGRFRMELKNRAGLNLVDVTDRIVLQGSGCVETIRRVGYVLECIGSTGAIYLHPGADLPRILVKRPCQKVEDSFCGLVIRCDFLPHAISALGRLGFKVGDIEGTPGGHLARAPILGVEEVFGAWLTERRGTQDADFIYEDQVFIGKIEEVRSLWRNRDRCCALGDEKRFAENLLRLSRRASELVRSDLSAALFLEVEREFWQSRNAAARRQRERLDALGLGWASRDHHTFRCSRPAFKAIINFFESLGFYCRERFYAGDSAGWGAQVLENPMEGAVIFADVDLLPGEKDIDYAHEELPPADKLGAIGRWCALHGMSVAQAGMHHLEIKCDFGVCRQLESAAGFGVMPPFNTSPELHQAFTLGEKWSVYPERLSELLAAGVLASVDAERIGRDGVLGSHLEHLERCDGYKGFSQGKVDDAIRSTDQFGDKR